MEGQDIELIVVDDSREFMEYPSWVRVDRHQGKRGATKCLNIGLSMAGNPYIVFLAEDSRAPVWGLTDLPTVLGDCSTQAVALHCVDSYSDFLPGKLASILLWNLIGQTFPERGDRPLRGRNLWSGFFAIDARKVSREFDERFRGSGFNAEVDFMLGLDTVYLPSLEVYHETPEDYAATVKRNLPLMVHNRGVFLEKRFRFHRVRKVFYVGYLLLMPLGVKLFRRTQSTNRLPRLFR